MVQAEWAESGGNRWMAACNDNRRSTWQRLDMVVAGIIRRIPNPDGGASGDNSSMDGGNLLGRRDAEKGKENGGDCHAASRSFGDGAR